MDNEVVEALRSAGADLSLQDEVLSVPIRCSDSGAPLPLGDVISVQSGDVIVPEIRLKRVTELFGGQGEAPSFANGPTPEYMWFFILIERTAIMYCTASGNIERDVEFEQIYRHLRRRPDGRHANGLFSYIQAATRLYMSIRDVSQLEFEAVLDRLALSAKHFSMGPTSRNYFDVVSKHASV